MAFKQIKPSSPVPDSPEQILLDSPRRKIFGVLHHQGEIIKNYVAKAVNVSDVALQLPTGSGKTLVGLLIAEWRRRKFQERVLFLCPNKQLVNQVVEQANDLYGLSVHGFTGSSVGFDLAAKNEYASGDRLGVTTYSALFNTNSYFHNADLLVIDDAHAAENYISKLWTFIIERRNPEHKAIHAAVSSVIKPLIASSDYSRLIGNQDGINLNGWVDKIPTPSLFSIKDELISVIDTYAVSSPLQYSWKMIRDNLLACHLYLTPNEIMIRPLIPPTWVHKPFSDAKQRIFMSATLGAGGDLERLTGRNKIMRLPVPEDWNRHGIGRRFFVFPGMSLPDSEAGVLRDNLMRIAGRSLVLVPSDVAKSKITSEIEKSLKFKVFSASDIEISKRPFIKETNAVAIVAGRYDGIDFPNDDCRLLFIDGLPQAVNAQELFIMTRMGANALFHDRVQTRVLQAIGRCTRSSQDFSAVVVTGEQLPEYFNDRTRRSYLHPELQAELEFGIEQSKSATKEDLIENFSIFLANSKGWEDANNTILNMRSQSAQKAFPSLDELEKVVEHELAYQKALWKGDYEEALAQAESVLGGLKGSNLRGYRALWHYLAGSAAWLGAQDGAQALLIKARQQFTSAKGATDSVSWLIRLARFEHDREDIPNITHVTTQVERLEAILVGFGTLHDSKYNAREQEILEGLLTTKHFENAQKLLGEMLGFEAGKEESDASPDPWWISGKLCLVFEDHAEALSTTVLNPTKARQAFTHPNWMKEKALLAEDMQCLPVLVSNVKSTTSGAIPHLHGVAFWSLDEFRVWAKRALETLRTLRRNFVQPGDLDWRSEASEAFIQNQMDANSLFKMLKANPASSALSIVDNKD